ncbi:hypothetical protein ASD65_08735 [Microbacterium sp. Root61]|uniref:hypothetical protein n=1 Tax=Microbacterium sp. Root61 TaxID=1736570 RepID=UPI0006F743CD|nr:hypothetical protein [Microbacterium sp. Root61]KRA24496.1 hypothetical protein ASD65_08735 [Microbacterium sp. Root61]
MTDPDNTDGYVPTTTHAEWGAGNPRLLITSDDERFHHEIIHDLTRIGSSPDSDLHLAGTDAHHATIAHDERDEYVLTLHGEGEMNAGSDPADETSDRTETLRTGARFTAGPWSLVFVRDEFADHGRPYGGREGGELSDQPSQPARPDYTSPVDDEPRPLEAPQD